MPDSQPKREINIRKEYLKLSAPYASTRRLVKK